MAARRDDLAVHNERVKLFAGFLNAIALGLIGFAILRPLVDDQTAISALTWVWGGAGLVLHGVAHYILRMLRKEVPHDDL